MEEPQEEEGSGWGLQEPKGFRSPSPLVEILEDQQFVEEEQDYVPICRVRCSPGQAVRVLPAPVKVLYTQSSIYITVVVMLPGTCSVGCCSSKQNFMCSAN